MRCRAAASAYGDLPLHATVGVGLVQDLSVAKLETTAAVRARMARQKSRNTQVEIALRRLLHSMGLRYRVHCRPLPSLRREADIVFGPARVAVFVDGCFWHGCPDHGTWPKNNAPFWRAKIEKNRERDRDTDDQLRLADWEPVRVWEHEPAEQAAERIAMLVRKRRAGNV